MVTRPLWAAALCLAAVTAVWLHFSSPVPEDFSLKDDSGETLAEGEELTVTGRVYRLETRSGYGREILQIYLDSVSIQREKPSGVVQAIPISYSLICETQTDMSPLLGSVVQMAGNFSYFSHATNPGEFDSEQYYRILGVGGMLKKGVIQKSSVSYSALREGMYRLKRYFEERLYECFPQKEASILCTMLLGDKASLDSGVKEMYQRGGIAHILSISGLHITLIGMGIYRLLRRCGCPTVVSAVLGGVLLLFYGGLTGMGVSACRAIGMYLIRMLGECLGRTYDMMTALGVMGILMLVRQPEYLRHSGFLLSFGSICGIGVFMPAMSAGLADGLRDRPPASPAAPQAAGDVISAWCRKLASGGLTALLPGISITLFTLPIQLFFFYEIPVYSVFLNLLVLPLMGIVMVTGLAVMLVPGLGFLGWICRLIFYVYEVLCGLFERLPGHTWTAGCPSLWQIAVYYGVILMVIAVGSRCRMRWKALALAGAAAVLGIRLQSGLMVTFLDVGQGDGICLRTQGGEIYLFDGGSSSESRLGKYTLIPFLKYYGIDRVDAIFLSHPDMDHCSGILELLEDGADNGIAIGRLVLPSIDEPRRREELGSLLDAAQECTQKQPVAVSWMAAGTSWNSGSTRFTCLHPPREYDGEGANAYSECFYVTEGDFSMLLTGDVEGAGEDLLMEELERRGIRDITVLKVAHHGSRNSTREGLLEILNPQLSVISCGEGNSYGHPHEELLDRLAQTETTVLQTPGTGAVQLRVDGKRLKIRRFLGSAGSVDSVK